MVTQFLIFVWQKIQIMKHTRITIAIILFFVTGCVWGQRNSIDLIIDGLPSVYGVTRENVKYKALKIQTIEYRQINAKGIERYSVEHYDTLGRMIGKEIFDNQGNFVASFHQTFNENMKRTSWTQLNKGVETKALMTYDVQNRLTKMEHFKNSELLEYSEYTYEENASDFAVLKRYNKKGLYEYIVNVFDANGVKIKSEYYNKKNKLKSSSDYTCPEVDASDNLPKNSSRVCKFDAVEGDYLISTVKFVYASEKMTSTVFKYRIVDSTLAEILDYRNEVLMSKMTFHPYGELCKEYVSYSAKGQEVVRNVYEYDERWNLIGEKTYIKGKLKLDVSWMYDNDGFRVKSDYKDFKKRTILTTSASVTAYHP
jgi:hypothetical protein